MATSKLKADFSNLQTGASVTPGAPLFAQIEVDGGASAALAKEKKKKVVSKKPEAFVDYTDADDTAASRLALVVGKIVDVWPHPDSDKLFCEKIDCGEAFGPVSGFFFAYSSSEVVKTNVGRGDGVLLR